MEIDESLHPQLEQTLKACERSCAAVGIRCRWEIRLEDFITMAVQSLDTDLFRSEVSKFDVAVLNPPYKKLRSDSTSRALLHRLGIETSNLYTAFVSLALLLLNDGGELVAITPRSFCNGPYFRPFRRHLLHHASLTHVRLFETRNQAFRDDEVLQENVILRAVKGARATIAPADLTGPIPRGSSPPPELRSLRSGFEEGRPAGFLPPGRR